LPLVAPASEELFGLCTNNLTILGVYDDLTPYPVRDLRAAKSRPLTDVG
jgi:hypothetical protein